MNNVGLYLLGEKGYRVLLHIQKINKIQLVKFIVSEKDLNVKNDYFKEIYNISIDQNIPFYTRNQKVIETNVNFCISIGWRWLLDIDKLIVLHDSLLPKYRGFNPLVTALIQGDSFIGVTSLFANLEMDKGDILFQEKIKINYPCKIQTAISLIIPLYSKIVEKLLNQPLEKIKKTPQNENDASYSIWRDELDYFIDWKIDSLSLIRFVNSLGFPYLGARTTYENRVIVIEEVEEVEDLYFVNRQPGKIFKIENNMPIVLCGKGMIKIKKAFYLNNIEIVKFNKVRSRLC